MLANRATFLEFFAGGGMARLGLAPWFDCVFANDVDAAKCAAYRANFGGEDLIEADIATLAADDIPAADLAWASFPCQDLSLAGARGGLGAARSGTFWVFWALMERMIDADRAPATLVIENVTGLLTSNGGEDFRTMATALTDGGYKVGALVLDAGDHVPQSRTRVFIIAHRGVIADHLASADVPIFNTPPALEATVRALPATVRDHWVWWTGPRPTSNRPPLPALLERRVDASVWRSEEKLARLMDQLPPIHRARVQAAEHTGSFQAGAVYRRMRAGRQTAEARYDGMAGCLRTLKGGSSRQLLLITEGGDTRLRPLLPIEGARLMGLPDHYKLPDTATAAFNLLGDGVCVPVVRALGETLLAPLLGTAPETAAINAE